MDKKFLRGLGALLLADGLSTLIFGRKYVRLYRFGARSSAYREAMEWLLDWPEWQLRTAGMGEAALGAAVMSQAPLTVQTLYRSVVAGYAAIDPGWREWFYPQAHRAFDRTLMQTLPEGGQVLDLGCGVGANLARMRALNLPIGSYTGVDLTDAMLQKANERYGHLPGVKFQQLDLMDDPLPAGPFDLILSTWVFEHLPDPTFVARKAWGNLKPGGHMVLLFESQADSWISRSIDRVYPFFSARLVRENEIQRLPGVQSDRRFSGPLGELALITSEELT